jgi:hypothetical protein
MILHKGSIAIFAASLFWTVSVAVLTWQTWPGTRYRVAINDGSQFDVITDGGQLSEQDVLNALNVAGLPPSRRPLLGKPIVLDPPKLASRRMQAVKQAVLLWLIPPIAVYAMTQGIRWVYGGFRPRPAPQT